MFDQDFKWTDDPMAEVLGLSTGTPPVSPNGYFENEYECYQWLFANDAVSDENHASLSYAEAVVNDKAEDAFAVETKPSGVSEVANSTLEGLVDFSGAEIEAFLKDEAPDCFDLCTYLDGTSSNQEINEIISNEPKSEGDATTTDVQTFFAQPIAYPTPTSSPQLNFVNTGSEHENGYIEEIVSEEILEDGEVSTIDQQNFNAKDYNYPSSTSSPSVLFTSPSYYQYPPQQWPQQQFYQPSFAVPGFPANGFNGNFLQWSQHGPVDETPEFGSGKAKKSKKPKSPARISRAQFADHQVIELERTFTSKFYLEPWERRVLADRIGLKVEQVRVWFQNRRSKQRRLGPLKPRRVTDIDGYA